MSTELKFDVTAIRDALGWSQQRLAEACGVDRSTISRWESEPPTKGPAFILLRQIHEQVAAGWPDGVDRPAVADRSLPEGEPQRAATLHPNDVDRVGPAGPDADPRGAGPAFSREAAE